MRRRIRIPLNKLLDMVVRSKWINARSACIFLWVSGILNLVMLLCLIRSDYNDVQDKSTNEIMRDRNVQGIFRHLTNEQHAHKKLLTIAVTAKLGGSSSVSYVLNNTRKHHAKFGSGVQVVFYADSDEDMKVLDDLGWTVRRAPQGVQDLPILRKVMMTTIEEFDSWFYAYVNSDIIFNYDLIHTLSALKQYLPTLNGLLITGQRTNLKLADLQLTKYNLTDYLSMKQFARQCGCLHMPYALDYFITTKTGFPWEEFPDLVVGSPGYDDWLVARALYWNVTVVDGTETILAVHQTGMDGDLASRRRDQRRPNYPMMRDRVTNWRYGASVCAPYLTYRDVTGRIVLAKRRMIFPICEHGSPEHKIPQFRCTSCGDVAHINTSIIIDKDPLYYYDTLTFYSCPKTSKH